MSDILIGREKECAAISDLINQRKNIIIFGAEGVGKSAIVNRVLSGFVTLNKFYSPVSKTLKESLLNFMMYDTFDKKTIQKADILALKKLFYEILAKKNPEYIIFDHVESVEPKFYSFFVYLMEEKIPLIVLSRGLEKKDIGHLRMSLFNFEKVEISNFDKPAADILIGHFIREFGIKITKEEDFKKQIFHFSKGNPKVIKGLCFLARDVKYKKNDAIDVKLMDLDRRINEVVH
jgi:2-hydroxy-3-keto-5-methylthiopentenyl-1-phosphate phosphatase